MGVLAVTKNTFEEEVLKSEKTVLVDFWASWCGPCRLVSPVIDEIAEENEDYKICKVNVDEENELAAYFEIMSIPSLFVFKNGEVVNHSVGVLTKEEILNLLNI